MERILPVVWMIAIGALLVLTVAAYFAGMEVWLGWGFVPALVVLIIACIVRDLGGLFVSVIAFVGMWKGWDWPVWQAFLAAFPSLALMVVGMLGGGIASVLAKRTRMAH